MDVPSIRYMQMVTSWRARWTPDAIRAGPSEPAASQPDTPPLASAMQLTNGPGPVRAWPLASSVGIDGGTRSASLEAMSGLHNRRRRAWGGPWSPQGRQSQPRARKTTHSVRLVRSISAIANG